jgi:hypothetical protein
MMYSSAIYSGEYARLIQCDECGATLLGVAKPFRGWLWRSSPIHPPAGNFCSRECKWIHAYRAACSIPGIRPITPMGAWGWATGIAWARSGPYCERCGKLIGRLITSKRYGTWWAEDGVEYHHIKPLYLGGNSLPENLEVLCPDCHRSRHRRRITVRRLKAEASQRPLDHFL